METMWPDGYEAPPDDFEWKLTDVVCSNCGATNQIHEQPEQWLTTKSGVVWECNNCSAANQLGGGAAEVPFEQVQECGSCHSTFVGGEGSALSTNAVDADGNWTCPVCDTPNKMVGGIETGTGTTGVGA